MSKIRVMLVDDHALIREGIKTSLAALEHIEVVAEAEGGLMAISKLSETEVDVVIMDVSMYEIGGAEATRKIIKKFPGVNVLVLSMHNEETVIMDMLQAGAIGYILKTTGMKELQEAIEVVAKGETYFAREVSSKVMNQLVKGKSSKTKVHLTKRETQILKLISEEFSNHEIADQLFISPRTVDTHRRNLIQKLNAKNTAGLVRYAIKNHIAEI